MFSAPATVFVQVKAVNDAPIAFHTVVTTAEDTVLELYLEAGDADGDNLVFILDTGFNHGTMNVFDSSTGRVIYTPNNNYYGTDSLMFRVFDSGGLLSATALLDVQVKAVNDNPIAKNGTLSINEDQQYAGSLSGYDPEGDSVTFVVEKQPDHGTISYSVPNGLFTYTPDENYHGIDDFYFTTNDATLVSKVAKMTIHIASINDIPAGVPVTYQSLEDLPFASALQYSDGDGDSAAFELQAQAVSGTVVVNLVTGEFSYTPHANKSGTDHFAVVLNDGKTNSDPFEIEVQVAPVNDAPDVVDYTINSTEDAVYIGFLAGSDVDSTNLVYHKISDGSKGAFEITDANTGAFTYVPIANYNGSDSFRYYVSDGDLDSAIATVTVNIANVNDGPVVQDLTFVLDEDTDLLAYMQGTDAEGDSVFFTISNAVQPTLVDYFTFNANSGFFELHPRANTNETDGLIVFVYRGYDGTTFSEEATISVRYLPVNDLPVALNHNTTTNEDTVLNDQVYANDADGGLLTYVQVPGSTRGTVNMSTDGKFSYTPPFNHSGFVDTFRYRADDGEAQSNIALVSITVNAQNDAPLVENKTFVGFEDKNIVGILPVRDPDDTVKLSIVTVTAPTHGTIASIVNNGGVLTLTYAPHSNYNGTDSYYYKADDTQGISNTGLITFSIAAVNDTPQVADQAYSLAEDSVVYDKLNVTDPDLSEGDTFVMTVVSRPQHGQLLVTAATAEFEYTPDADYNGMDSFVLQVRDRASAFSGLATINLAFTAQNDNPQLLNTIVRTSEDVRFVDSVNAIDADGDSLTLVLESFPVDGTLTTTAGLEFSFEPNNNYVGVTSFTAHVLDGHGGISGSGAVTIHVGGTNDAPVAVGGTVAIPEDSSHVGYFAASDADGDTLSIFIVKSPEAGTLTWAAGSTSYTYAPNPDYDGNDALVFYANDTTLNSNLATLVFAITASNDAPVAMPSEVSVAEDNTYVGFAKAHDVDSNPLEYAVVVTPADGAVIFPDVNSAQFLFTPVADYAGQVTFVYQVRDSFTEQATAVVTVNINPQNDAPVAIDYSQTAFEDIPLTLALRATDSEHGINLYHIVQFPQSGTIETINAVIGAYKYHPNANFNGTDELYFYASDGDKQSNVAKLTLNVASVEDHPIAKAMAINVVEDTEYVGKFDAYDPDSDGYVDRWVIVDYPTWATAENLGNGTFKIKGAPDQVTQDLFTYLVVDEDSLASNTVLVTVNFNAINDAPRGENVNRDILEDQTVNIALPGEDPEGDAITWVILSGPFNGNVQDFDFNNGTFEYTPKKDFNGGDVLQYRVDDGDKFSPIYAYSINISGVNDAPVATAMQVVLEEDGSYVGILNGRDVDREDTLIFVVEDGSVSAGSEVSYSTLHGLLAYNIFSGLFRYVPEPNHNDLEAGRGDQFSFRVMDGKEYSAAVTVNLQVNPVNDRPFVPATVNASVLEDHYLSLQLTGSDVDTNHGVPDVLSWTPFVGPLNGQFAAFTAPTGEVRYKPAANFNGNDTFTYQAVDLGIPAAQGNLFSNVGAVNITVIPVNDAPVAADSVYTNGIEDTDFNGTMQANDVDYGQELTYVITENPAATAATIAYNPMSGTFTITPAKDYYGWTHFKFFACDNEADGSDPVEVQYCTQQHTVRVYFMNVNDAPVLQKVAAISKTEVEAATVWKVHLSGYDADADTVYIEANAPKLTASNTVARLRWDETNIPIRGMGSVAVGGQPKNACEAESPLTVCYQVDPDYFGTVSIRLRATDGLANSWVDYSGGAHSDLRNEDTIIRFNVSGTPDAVVSHLSIYTASSPLLAKENRSRDHTEKVYDLDSANGDVWQVAFAGEVYDNKKSLYEIRPASLGATQFRLHTRQDFATYTESDASPAGKYKLMRVDFQRFNGLPTTQLNVPVAILDLPGGAKPLDTANYQNNTLQNKDVYFVFEDAGTKTITVPMNLNGNKNLHECNLTKVVYNRQSDNGTCKVAGIGQGINVERSGDSCQFRFDLSKNGTHSCFGYQEHNKNEFIYLTYDIIAKTESAADNVNSGQKLNVFVQSVNDPVKVSTAEPLGTNGWDRQWFESPYGSDVGYNIGSTKSKNTVSLAKFFTDVDGDSLNYGISLNHYGNVEGKDSSTARCTVSGNYLYMNRTSNGANDDVDTSCRIRATDGDGMYDEVWVTIK